MCCMIDLKNIFSKSKLFLLKAVLTIHFIYLFQICFNIGVIDYFIYHTGVMTALNSLKHKTHLIQINLPDFPFFPLTLHSCSTFLAVLVCGHVQKNPDDNLCT